VFQKSDLAKCGPDNKFSKFKRKEGKTKAKNASYQGTKNKTLDSKGERRTGETKKGRHNLREASRTKEGN